MIFGKANLCLRTHAKRTTRLPCLQFNSRETQLENQVIEKMSGPKPPCGVRWTAGHYGSGSSARGGTGGIQCLMILGHFRLSLM